MTRVLEQVAKPNLEIERPTAVVCYNDELAIQIMDVIRSLDLTIPETLVLWALMISGLVPLLRTALNDDEHPKEKMGLDGKR